MNPGAQIMSDILVSLVFWVELHYLFMSLQHQLCLDLWQLARNISMPRTGGKDLISWIICLPLSPSLGSEGSDVLIGYTKMMWNHLHKPPALICKGKIKLFPKRPNTKTTNVPHSCRLLSLSMKKTRIFWQIVYKKNELNHKMHLMNRCRAENNMRKGI